MVVCIVIKQTDADHQCYEKCNKVHPIPNFQLSHNTILYYITRCNDTLREIKNENSFLCGNEFSFVLRVYSTERELKTTQPYFFRKSRAGHVNIVADTPYFRTG